MLTHRLKIRNKTSEYPNVLLYKDDLNAEYFGCMKISEDLTEINS